MLRRSSRRRATAGRLPALLLLLLTLAVVLAGCSRESAQDVISAAPEKTLAAKTSRMALDVKVTGSQQGDVSLSGEGAFDFAARKGTLDLKLPLGAEGGTIRSVINGQIVYQKYPKALAGQIPGGKAWIKIDLDKIENGAGAGQTNDPAQSLGFLRGATSDAEKVGDEEVRGVDTTRYRATLDLKEAAKASGQEAAAVENLIKQAGTNTVPADVWIDGDGRLARMRYEVPLKDQGEGAKVTTTVELYDFGTVVKADPPPASQVSDASALLNTSSQGKN
jgi:hypothetical protein